MLKFQDHATTVVKKCKYLMSVIKRSFKCFDKKMMIDEEDDDKVTELYKSFWEDQFLNMVTQCGVHALKEMKRRS